MMAPIITPGTITVVASTNAAGRHVRLCRNDTPHPLPEEIAVDCESQRPIATGEPQAKPSAGRRVLKLVAIALATVGVLVAGVMTYDATSAATSDARRLTGTGEFCEGRLCTFGEGDCDTASQGEDGITEGCDSSLGLICGNNNGDAWGMPSSYEVCICDDGLTWSAADGKCVSRNSEFCADRLCTFGEGDCDTVSQGEEGIVDGCDASKGLVCGNNNGADFGQPSTYEVCICESGYTWSAVLDKCVVVDSELCADRLCTYGEGDCDTPAQGEEGIVDGCNASQGLVCGNNNGAEFGLSSSWEVCICESGYTWSAVKTKCVRPPVWLSSVPSADACPADCGSDASSLSGTVTCVDGDDSSIILPNSECDASQQPLEPAIHCAATADCVWLNAHYLKDLDCSMAPCGTDDFHFSTYPEEHTCVDPDDTSIVMADDACDAGTRPGVYVLQCGAGPAC